MIDNHLLKVLPGIQKNIPLKNYTTFEIGGSAKYFFVAKTKEDIISAINLAKKSKLPFFILGGGSNLLVSDRGFNGIVIKIQYSTFDIQDSKIVAGAGVPLNKLVSISVEKGLTGLEWAIGIPGTIGGAIWGNAGLRPTPRPSLAQSMKDLVKEVEVCDAKSKKIKKFKNKDCKFGYRDSIFKHKKNLIVLSATLQLKKGNKKEIKNQIKKNLDQRRKTQPLDLPSAGSVFKNPKHFSAAYLIEKCGLKGKKIGDAQISEKHANFIVNLGNGKAKDVKKLIDLIKKKVKKKFGVILEEEIQFL